MPSRRDFLTTAGSFALTAAAAPARAAMGPNDKFDLVIKGGDVLDPSQSLRGKRDIGIRYGVIEAVEADIPAARALRVLDAGGKLVTPGPDRPAQPRLSLRLGDRHSGGRTGRASVHHHLRVGGRCRRQQFRGVPPLHRGADPHAALCLRAHRQYRAHAVPGRRALQHRLRAGRCLRQGGRRERRHGARRQGAHVGERHRQARARAAQARDRGVREGRHRRQGDVPHRRRRDARADVADPRHAAAGRHPHALPIRARPTSPAPSPTSCRTASCCPRRSPPSSAA